MAGFHPLIDRTGANRDHGYRHRAIKSQLVSYNGYVFPPALHSRITIVPEYDQSNRTVKYITVAINIDFVMTDPNVKPEEIGGLNNQGISNAAATNLISRLSIPGQKLSFPGQGLGRDLITVNGGTGFTSDSLSDIDFGPKPQVTEIEPMGAGNALKVSWLCVTRIPACLESSDMNDFIEFNYHTSWGIDTPGFMVRTIEGTVVFPGIHQNTSQEFAGGDIFPRREVGNPVHLYHRAKQHILEQFPWNPGFKRNYSWRLREDKRTLEFRVEDTEIRSESPYPPGVADIDMSENINTNIENGFIQWNVSYSGRVETVNSKEGGFTLSESKKLAFFWIMKIITSKRKRFAALGQQVRGGSGDADLANPGHVTADPTLEHPASTTREQYDRFGMVMYPSFFSVTDEIYSNTIQFTVSYIAYTTSNLIFRGLGMFEPVKPGNLDRDTWVRWIQDTGAHNDSIEPYPGEEVIVDLCHDLTGIPRFTTPQEKGAEKELTADKAEIIEDDKEVIDYQNQVIYETDNKPVTSTKLLPTEPRKLDEDTSDDNRMNAYPYEGNTEPAKNDGTTSYYPSLSTKYVTLVGRAISIGKPIAAPRLISVGGVEATFASSSKNGTDLVKSKVVPTGVLDMQGKPVDIYITVWRRSFVLNGTPGTMKNSTVETTGIPHRHI